MNRHLKQAWWLALVAGLITAPSFSHAAEAPGGLSVEVRDLISSRPLLGERCQKRLRCIK